MGSSTPVVSGGSPNLNTTGPLVASVGTPFTLTAGTPYWMVTSSDSSVLALEALSSASFLMFTAAYSNYGSTVGSTTGNGSSIAFPGSITVPSASNPGPANGYSYPPMVMLTR